MLAQLLHRAGKTPFYGWVVAVTAMIIYATLEGVGLSFGVFFKSLETEFNMSRTAVSSVVSVQMVLSAVFATLGGWALDRFGARRVITVMGLLTGLSLLLSSRTTSFWQLYFAYSILLSAGVGGDFPVLMTVVSRWFPNKRGLALGIATSGSPAGITILAPLAAYLIMNTGWRLALLVLCPMVSLIVISLAGLIKDYPRSKGTIHEQPAKMTVAGENHAGEARTVSFRGILRSKPFWLILGIWLGQGACIRLILTHLVSFALDVGIRTAEAAVFLSVMGALSIVSRLVMGRVSDRAGRQSPAIICAIIEAAALIGLIWARPSWSFYLFAVVFGFSWGGIAAISTALVADVFSGRNLGKIMGALTVGFAMGAAVGPALGGVSFDNTGSYSLAFAAGGAIMLMSALLIFLTRRQTHHSSMANPAG